MQSLSLLIITRQKLVVWFLGLSIVSPLYIIELFDGEFGLYNSLVFVIFLFTARTANSVMITTLDFQGLANGIYLLMTEFDRLFV